MSRASPAASPSCPTQRRARPPRPQLLPGPPDEQATTSFRARPHLLPGLRNEQTTASFRALPPHCPSHNPASPSATSASVMNQNEQEGPEGDEPDFHPEELEGQSDL